MYVYVRTHTHTHTHTHTYTHTSHTACYKWYPCPGKKPANKLYWSSFWVRIRDLKLNRPYWSQITPNYRIAIILSPGIVTAFTSCHFFSGAFYSIWLLLQYHLLSPLLSNKHLSLGFFTVPSNSYMSQVLSSQSPTSLCSPGSCPSCALLVQDSPRSENTVLTNLSRVESWPTTTIFR